MLALLILLAIAFLGGWWVKWTVHVFAGIARNLCQAALSVGTIIRLLWQLVSTPRAPDLLGEFLERRRAARH